MSERGFTLIEVLVALAILAVALGALVGGAAQQAGNAAHLQQKTLAHWVAVNEINRLRLTADTLTTGETGGEAELAGVLWYWTARVTGSPAASVRKVAVSVALREDDEPIERVTAFLPLTYESEQP